MNILYIVLNFLIIFNTSSYADTPYCQSQDHKENVHLNSIKEDLRKEIETNSNNELVAKEADSFLSKLIQSNSPMIINWINKRQLNPKNQSEEIAKKWRQYYFENFIIRRYPNKSKKINYLVEKIFNNINNKSFPKSVKSKFEKIFNEAKLLSIKRIENSKINQKTKKEIINKFKEINIYWFKQLSNSKFEKNPFEFIRWGVAYDPIPNQINIGIEALSYTADETIFSVFAHEIGHSIDPCRWGAFMKEKNPFKEVIACLRGKKSANAKKRDDSSMEILIKKGIISKELARSLERNPTCNKTSYPPIDFQKDQIQEVFADWFSAEVIATSKNYITKSLRADLCKKKKLIEGSSYIPNNRRLQSIYFANPLIKKKLKVSNSFRYCHLNQLL